MIMIERIGSFYFNGAAVQPGVKYSADAAISFGDTVPGKELSFIRYDGNLFVSNSVICTNISWAKLNTAGFIFGKKVKIDGMEYLCRAIKVGSTEDDMPYNEWGAILNTFGEEDDVWHWKKSFFWGQEEALDQERVICGYHNARYWTSRKATYKNTSLGFRPVLELLSPTPLVANSKIGTLIAVYGPGTEVLCGTVAEITDYDLILKETVRLIGDDNIGDITGRSMVWYKQLEEDSDRVAINRASIVWISSQTQALLA